MRNGCVRKMLRFGDSCVYIYIAYLLFKGMFHVPQNVEVWRRSWRKHEQIFSVKQFDCHSMAKVCDHVETPKIPPPLNKAQAAHPLSSPFDFPTPFCKACYLKLAGFAEWCFFFCGKTAENCTKRSNYNIFSIFHKEDTAFSGTIRGPPSEIWFHHQIYKRRSAKWQIRKSTLSKLKESW